MSDGAANLASLRVPRGWRAAGGLSEGQPAIQIVDVVRNGYFTITSTPKEDIDPHADLVDLARWTHESMADDGRIVAVVGPEATTVGEFPAIVYEIEYTYRHYILKYLHVTIQGRRACHQVLA